MACSLLARLDDRGLVSGGYRSATIGRLIRPAIRLKCLSEEPRSTVPPRGGERPSRPTHTGGGRFFRFEANPGLGAAGYKRRGSRRPLPRPHADQQLRPILEGPLAEEKLIERRLDQFRERLFLAMRKLAANVGLAVLVFAPYEQGRDGITFVKLAGYSLCRFRHVCFARRSV